MVKPKIEGETEKERFKRIATARTVRILQDIRLLSNCANRGYYVYSPNDVSKIFNSIEKETKRVKSLFEKGDDEFSL